jgi:hypothetical protein
VSADRPRWAFISLIVGGAIPSSGVPTDRWGGQVLVTLHEDRRAPRRFVATVPASRVSFSTSRADLAIGESRVTVLSDGRYEVRARAAEEGRPGSSVEVSLVITPTPHAYFPGASLGSGDFVSGYVVPALRADGRGRICAPDWCERLDAVQAYHDHNWGTWRGVMIDVRGEDTLRLDLEVEDAAVTDTRRPTIERGDASPARALRRPYFVQMKGRARLSGRVGGRALVGEGTGFFETYR